MVSSAHPAPSFSLGFRASCNQPIIFCRGGPVCPPSVTPHPGHGEDLHPACPRPAQNPGALFHRGAGGVEVIDEQHVLAFHWGRVRYGKGPFDVFLPLLGVEPHLRRGGASGRTSTSRATRLGQGLGQEQRLVEAPGLVRRVQGHGGNRSAAVTNSRQAGCFSQLCRSGSKAIWRVNLKRVIAVPTGPS